MVGTGRQGRQTEPLLGLHPDTELELLASPDTTINGGTRVCVPANVDRAKLVALIRTMRASIRPRYLAAGSDGCSLRIAGIARCERRLWPTSTR